MKVSGQSAKFVCKIKKYLLDDQWTTQNYAAYLNVGLTEYKGVKLFTQPNCTYIENFYYRIIKSIFDRHVQILHLTDEL